MDQNNVVISEKLANRLFDDVNEAIGKTLNFKSEFFTGTYMISGVYSPNINASYRFDILLTYEHFLSGRPRMRQWNNGGTHAHLILSEGVDLDAFNAKIKNFIQTKNENSTQTIFAQKYSEKYLYGKYENGFPVEGRIVYVRIFSYVSLFVLIIACINYMNLSTAQASKRVKEIGVKKAIGAQRGSLMYQYFGESILMTFTALILAIGIVTLLLPVFNQITDKQLALELKMSIILPVLIITFLTGVISGIYPGLYLSGFNTILSLKGITSTGLGGLWLRKGLVIFQFAISIVLIIVVIVTFQQINFIQNKNLGYDREHLISFPREGKLYEGDAEVFMSELKSLAGVEKVSYMWGSLPANISGGGNFQWKNQEPEERRTRFQFIEGGYDVADVLGVEVVEGRNLSNEFATDENAVVLNEAALEVIGYEDPIGQQVYMRRMCRIVGIVKNFHVEDMHEEIKPFFFIFDPEGDNFLVRIQAENQIATINKIKELHETFNPGYPFDFKFVDDNYQKQFQEEKRVATLSKYFAGVAIAISCLGLLGLTAFSTQRRFKEVTIRKVLGSSQISILRLLSKEFLILVSLSVVIAIPVGYYLMKNWLDDFAYRINLELQYFVLAGIVVLVIAWLTIMAQITKSARVNVTSILRGE